MFPAGCRLSLLLWWRAGHWEEEQNSPPPVISGNVPVQVNVRKLHSPLCLNCFRLMVPGSIIQFVHKHMGLVPGWGGAARLVHIVGSPSALKLLAGAVKVGPELSLQIGLTDGVLEVPQQHKGDDTGTVLQQAEDWISRYTTGAAPVIQAVKKVVLSGRELPLSEALRTEKDVFGTVWGGPANLQALASKPKHK